MDRKTVALLVMAPGRRVALVEHLSRCGVEVLVEMRGPRPAVLLVMPPGRRAALVQYLKGCGVDALEASDCEQSLQILRTWPGVQIVVTDVALSDDVAHPPTLKDGCWLHVMEELVRDHITAP